MNRFKIKWTFWSLSPSSWSVWPLSLNIFFQNQQRSPGCRREVVSFFLFLVIFGYFWAKLAYIYIYIYLLDIFGYFCWKKTPSLERPSSGCPAKAPPAPEESATPSEVLPAGPHSAPGVCQGLPCAGWGHHLPGLVWILKLWEEWFEWIMTTSLFSVTLDDGKDSGNHPLLWPQDSGKWNILFYPEWWVVESQSTSFRINKDQQGSTRIKQQVYGQQRQLNSMPELSATAMGYLKYFEVTLINHGCLENPVGINFLLGKSLINGQFWSKPCWITGG